MAKEEKIEEILEKTDEVTSVTQNENSMEFSFKGGLVFENMAILEDESEKPSEPQAAEEILLSEDDEFALPDIFQIDEKYNTPPTPDTPTTIFRTYVPKFTDASENYRMINDPRPRPKVEPKTQEPAKNTDDTERIDPIAELEVEHTDAVTVNIKGKEDGSSDTLNVFKFAEAVSVAQGQKRIKTVEDEKIEIENLLKSEKREEPAPAPMPEPEPQPEPEVIEREEPKKNYSIPDPTDEMRVIDYGKANDKPRKKHTNVEPDGVSDEVPATKKKTLGESEFNSQAERDEFKDAFLDSIMSIKIRSIAMAVIALLVFVYETFLVKGNSDILLGLGIYSGIYGTVDFAFVAAMFALSIPEVVRAVKYLTRGRVIPEFTLLVAFIVEAAYTIIVASAGALDTPLYGFLFGTFSIATVISAYYRVSADFTAFKVVSRNTEKQFLDKKLTRTLAEENMALDGVIDEYKSRTSRIFCTAFISDFFKRIRKVSENTFATVLPTLIAFVVALLTGIIVFAISGIVSAAAAFTVVMLLAMPAFSMLVHKLPYFDAQLAALDEESTLVGEAAYRSFASVDVMAFDDTDIFGAEDVNLRRMMLYGDKNDMEGAMKQMSALFAAVGGPLDLIFKKTLDRQCRPASDVSIEADGLCGLVDGASIAAGTEEYMLRHNIAIPELSQKREMGVDTTKVMYAAENGEIYAKFYIRYSFSEEFTMLLPSIKAEGIVPLIYTRDPNLSNELLKTLSAGSDSMRVMRKYHPLSEDGEKLYRRVSAELVTYGDNINAINTVLLTKKYRRFGQQISGTELYASVFGAALAAILSIFGLTAVPTFVYALWQIALCVALRLASKSAFPRASLEKDNNN